MELRLCYFNGYWNPYFYTKDGNYKFETEHEEYKDVSGGKMRLTKYKHDEIPCLYSFGLTIDDPKHKPGHGGEWSSNSYEVNKLFNTDLKEVVVNQMSVAVSLEWLKELLKDKVEWGTIVNGQFPVIKEIIGEKPEYYKWVTIYQS